MKKILSFLLVVLLTVTVFTGTAATAFAAERTTIDDACSQCGDYLYKTVKTPAFGSVCGEWMMYGFARAGFKLSDEYIKTYKSSVEKTVKAADGNLSNRKYTEYSRVIIAYSALGLDPTDICGYNMLEKLADFDSVVWQGINGPICALRALDAGNYQVPQVETVKNLTTRNKLIDYILDRQLSDGGWNLSGNSADPDITAMAMETLAPYYYKKSAVKSALDKAVTCMSRLQKDDGGYMSVGVSNAESNAQAICGLVAMGINPNSDKRFVKNGKSVIDALLSFRDSETGAFRHINTSDNGQASAIDQMATEQAYYALAAYKKSLPYKAVVSRITSPKAGTLKVSWKKASVASGYQIKIARDKSFTKNVKAYTVKGRTVTAKTVSGLTKGKTYYVKVRTYKIINGHKVYGNYSSYKKITVK